MNKLILHLIVASVVVIAVAPAQAVQYIAIEQSSQDTVLGSPPWEQTFVANTGNILAVSVYITADAASNVTVQILDGVCGNQLRVGAGSGTGVGWVKCDLSGAQGLVPGNTYSIVVNSDQDFGGSTFNPYANGSLWRGCLEYSSGEYDLTFRVWADEEIVPANQTTWSTVKSLYK